MVQLPPQLTLHLAFHSTSGDGQRTSNKQGSQTAWAIQHVPHWWSPKISERGPVSKLFWNRCNSIIFHKILTHQGPLESDHPDYKRSKYNLEIECWMGNRGDLLGNSTNQEEDTEDSQRRHVGARPSISSHHLRQREQPFGHRRMETSLSYPILHPHHQMGSVIAPAAAQYHTKSSKNLIPCNIHTKSYPILKPNHQ